MNCGRCRTSSRCERSEFLSMPRSTSVLMIPAQDLYLVTLGNGYSFAARGSGTEPKMKFYLFATEPVKDAASLPAAKAKAQATLDALKALMEADARKRAEG